MRETFRDIFLALGVIFAGIQAWQGIKHPEQIGRVAPWFVVVLLFLTSATLYIVGVYLNRRTNKNKVEHRTPTETSDTFHNPRWEIINNHKFMNESIDVDGKSFHGCTFTNVRFLFHGGAPTEFRGKSQFEGSIVLSTDHRPTMFWFTLHHIFSNIPGAVVESSPVDDKGHKVTPRITTE